MIIGILVLVLEGWSVEGDIGIGGLEGSCFIFRFHRRSGVLLLVFEYLNILECLSIWVF